MKRILSSALALLMIVSLAACDLRTKAASMHLRHAEGTVSVSDSDGKEVPPLDNLSLYSGYGVNTRAASYAWIDLDNVKLVKLDQSSEIAIQKEDKALDIELKAGSLFFNVTEPLADDESMNIRASTLLVGIRGTCGWVEYQDSLSRVYLLEGKVECSAGDQTVQVSAGEVGSLTQDGKLVVEPFDEQDLPAFVRDDLDSSADETPGPDGPGPGTTGGEGPGTTPGEPEGDITWSYSDGVLTISGTGRMPDYDRTAKPWDAYCSQIRTVMVGNGVTSIGNCAFEYCSSLTRVTIPASVTTIGDSAFYDCGSLTSVTIPKGVVSIGDSAFWLCSSLTGVTIPDSVTSIGGSAFGHCGSLTRVTIPASVTSIGPSAFSSCGSLTSVTIPASVTSIGAWAFYSCGKLAEVRYGGSESQWGQIDIGYSNSDLLRAARYYNS